MNKVAIVTAASKGMGAAAARRLSSDGFNVALMARSEQVREIAKEIDGIAFLGSVESGEDLEGFVGFVLKKWNRIDVVVNNTGHSAKGDLIRLTDQDWENGFNLLFMNVVKMSRLIVPVMEKQGGGSIINISSFAALEPSLEFPVSSAIRAGLAAYTKLFSDRYAGVGIRMNTILPGFIDSYPVPGETLEKIPSGRAGKVEEIAGIVSFLASEDSAYINGQNISADGGLSRSI